MVTYHLYYFFEAALSAELSGKVSKKFIGKLKKKKHYDGFVFGHFFLSETKNIRKISQVI